MTLNFSGLPAIIVLLIFLYGWIDLAVKLVSLIRSLFKEKPEQG